MIKATKFVHEKGNKKLHACEQKIRKIQKISNSSNSELKFVPGRNT